jgi:hypothetical protein
MPTRLQGAGMHVKHAARHLAAPSDTFVHWFLWLVGLHMFTC